MNHKTYFSLTVGTAFSCFGLYLAFAFRSVPVASLLKYAAQIHYGWMIPAAVTLMLVYLVRSVRRQWLLMPAGWLRLPSASHSISMMANCLPPGRMGELVRPTVLKRLEALPFPYVKDCCAKRT
jgi:glycosyltransferase 2 family protein